MDEMNGLHAIWDCRSYRNVHWGFPCVWVCAWKSAGTTVAIVFLLFCDLVQNVFNSVSRCVTHQYMRA